MADLQGHAADPNQAAPTHTSSGTAAPTGAGSITDAPKTLTQADVDAIISRRLAEKEAALMQSLRERYGDLDDLKKKAEKLTTLEQADMTELQRAQQALADEKRLREQKEQEASEAKLHALRLEVGQVKGLSPLLASRLQGTTREALEADADAVVAELGPKARLTPPNLDATAGGGQGEGGPKSMKLTPSEQNAARASHMTDQQYLEAKQKMLRAQKEGQ